MWGLLRDAEALAVNAAARERVTDPTGVTELTLNEGLLLTYSGRPRRPRVLGRCPTIPIPGPGAAGAGRAARPGGDRTVRHGGRPAGPGVRRADGPARPGGHPRSRQPHPHPGLRAGRVRPPGGGQPAGTAAYEATPASAPPNARMWLAHQIGRCALLAGQLATARRWLTEALARSEDGGLAGPRCLVLSALATAAAGLGDAEAAPPRCASSTGSEQFPFTRPEQELGRAWAKVAAGDLPGARQVLRGGADRAAEAGYRVCEAWLLHDVARLGEPATVADRLAVLAERCEGDLVGRLRRPRRGGRRRRRGGPGGGRRPLRGAGALLLAAEAATEAAQACAATAAGGGSGPRHAGHHPGGRLRGSPDPRAWPRP